MRERRPGARGIIDTQAGRVFVQVQLVGLRTDAMVSAESLNFDVLQIIFSYLSPPDLASVSQVSQSFLAGALPRLYRSLCFYHNQAKRYPKVRYPSRPRVSTPVCCDSCLPEKIVTPFAVVTAHPHLAAHVQALGRCLSFFRDVEFDLIPL